MVGVVMRGVNGNAFNFQFSNRSNYDMLDDIGKSLLKLEKSISGGILVFFPSYNLLEKTIKHWKNSEVSLIYFMCCSEDTDQIYCLTK